MSVPLADARIRKVADGVVQLIQSIDGNDSIFSVKRALSLYFEDSELSKIQVSVVPEDISEEQADNQDGEEERYLIRVVVTAKISRTVVPSGDKPLDLMSAIYTLFRLGLTMTLTGETEGLKVIGKRLGPLVLRNTTTMDVKDSSTRFVSTLYVTLREWVKP